MYNSIAALLFLGGIAVLFTPFLVYGIPAIILGLILMFFRFFYNTHQIAIQSKMTHVAVCGGDADYKNQTEEIKGQRGAVRFIAFISLLLSMIPNRNSNGGIMAVIVNILLAVLREVWDLMTNFLIPAVVVDSQKLKEAAGSLKQLKKNVPATIAGVLGFDLFSSLISSIMLPVFLVLGGLMVGIPVWLHISYSLLSTQIIIFSTIAFILIVSIIGIILSSFVSTAKIMYFTIFYVTLMHPEQIPEVIRPNVLSYLSGNDFKQKQ